MQNIDIIYEDRDIIICHKPSGLAVQTKSITSPDLEHMLMNYLANDGQEVYLGVIHRLDQPVEGIVLFAKTKNAAASLNKQLAEGKMSKTYYTLVKGHFAAEEGLLEDYLIKDGKSNTSKVVSSKTSNAKLAKLEYQVIKQVEDRSLLRINLLTGRHHQIRVQLSNAGCPIIGDKKYNENDDSSFPLALCGAELSFNHPRDGKRVSFKIEPKNLVFKI